MVTSIISINISNMRALKFIGILATIATFGYAAVNFVYHDGYVHNQGKWNCRMSALQPSASSANIDNVLSRLQTDANETESPFPISTPVADDLANSFTSQNVDDVHPLFLRTGSDKVTRRRLPGDFNIDPGEMSGIVIVVILVLILFCCFRGMLCDILACVCLYEICCGDAAIGGFELM
jgi:hypothetical protein